MSKFFLVAPCIAPQAPGLKGEKWQKGNRKVTCVPATEPGGHVVCCAWVQGLACEVWHFKAAFACS